MTSPPATPAQKDQVAKKIQRELTAHLAGGTKKVPGVTGQTKVKDVLRRMDLLKIRGRSKLIKTLGKERVADLESEAKRKFVKSWFSMASQMERKPKKSELARIPEKIRKDLGIVVAESKLIQERKGFSRWEEPSGRRTWRDLKGRYSKKPSERSEL